MPSGAKKRKAAKKKKEIQSTNPSSNNNPQQQQQGENELKSIDEKGSDGGEGDSPAYRNHDDHNQFNEGSEEVEEIEQSAAVAKSSEEVRNDDKIDDKVEGGKEGVVEIEWDMKSEESCENKDVSVVQIESAKESDYRNGNSVGSNDVTETGAAKNLKDESSYNNSVKDTDAFDEVVDSVKESVNSVTESSADSVNAVTSVSERQSGDTGSVTLEKSLDSRVVETDLAGKRSEDKVNVLPDEDVRTSSLVDEPETREFDSTISSAVSQSPNGVEHVKDSNAAECSGNQPPVASAPLRVHKTSWLSCCGLLDVLSGSNR
ncbi:uncharacterized protein LOC123884107 [Trifolium pratense]|uniref:Uncharacterized protein n=1 Tax=Trifolium pratense TaxID=57577 RepID=A0ACB0IMZ3_TRIPR|nr:uncharacterized protein LOC123884107 [Trifolium pratense]CAJ2633461.1 unnamed protein product [Trifolium pratense]